MAYRDEVLDDSPLLYWRLGEASGTTAADETANGKTGTYNNSPTLNVTGALVNDTNKAITCDGTNDSVSRNDTALRLSTGSVEVWFKTTRSSTVANQALAVMRSWFGIYILSGKLQVYSFGAAAFRDTGIIVNDGEWHQAVMTFNTSTNGTRVYLDGCLVLTTTVTAGTADNSAHFCCGAQNTPSANTNAYTGSLDEVSVYTTELSAKRVARHYLAGRNRLLSYKNVVQEDLPASYLRLGEATGTVAENIGDGAGSGVIAGTYVNSPTLAQTGAIAGDSDTSVAFDGVNDYVDTNLNQGDDDIQPIGVSHSYELWFKQDVAPTTGKAHRLVFWGNKTTYTPNGHQETIHVSGTSGNLTFQRYNNSQDQGANYAYSKTNTWTHVVGTYDDTDGKMRLYVDGHLRSTVTPTNTITISSSADILLGHDLGTPANLGLDGNIDEFAYYVFALSPKQVSEHCAAAYAEITDTAHTAKASISPASSVSFKPGRVAGAQYSATATVTVLAPSIGFIPARTSMSATTSVLAPTAMAAVATAAASATTTVSAPAFGVLNAVMNPTATVTVLSPMLGFVPLRAGMSAATSVESQAVALRGAWASIAPTLSVAMPGTRVVMASGDIGAPVTFTANGWQPIPLGAGRIVGSYKQRTARPTRENPTLGAIVTVRQGKQGTTRTKLDG